MSEHYWHFRGRYTWLYISKWFNPILGSLPFVLILLTLAILSLLILLVAPPQPALAQGGGTITHTTVADFGAACGVLSNVSVSSANGGEIRLAATVEDYFDGNSIDNGRWLTGTVYDWYTVPPSVSGGVVTLDSAYLRSQVSFNQNTPVRFFETRALQRINSNNASWPDLGFYRELPPLAYGSGPYPNDSSLRIFVTRDTNTTFIRGRDGDGSAPLIDVDIPTLDLTQYHNFRIEWDASETRFYVDGVFRGTIPGVSTLNTWVFLYSQDPATSSGGRSPMQVDWVRAGAYPTSGTYTSCAQDAGQVVNWTSLTPAVNQPASTAVTFSTRTSADGVNWSSWVGTSGSAISSPAGRYLQYRATLGTSNVMTSPEVQQVSLSYGPLTGPTNTPTATNTPAPPTNTPTPTNTPIPPTNTPTPTDTPTNTPTFTPTFTPTPLPDLLFSDSFESGNLSAWSASTTDGGDLSVTAAAALVGANGLQGVLDNNTSIYVTDDRPLAESRYRARFYFDPNTITMTNGNAHYLFYGYSGTSTVVTRVEFRRSSGAYQLRAALRNDGSTFTNTSWFTLSDAPHYIELDWRAATGAGANNGGLTLWIDGTQQANLTSIDNDTRRIDRVRLGAVAGVDSGTRGTYYFDAFEARRQSYIGPDTGATPTPTNTPIPPTSTPTNTPAPPTNTPTNTPVPPTATNTPVSPTNTPTNTPVPPTATNTPVSPTNTPTPIPTNTAVPASNFALSFDGLNDVVQAGQIPNSSALTIEAWVRPGVNNANSLLVVQGDDNTGWSLELNSGQATLWLLTNQGWQSAQHSTVLQSGQWYHVAATYDSGSARVFVNGVSSTAVSVGTLTQGPALQLGGLAGYSYFNGALDEVRVSNVIRYSANFSVPTVPYTVDGNTLGLWRFNEGSGQVAADSSGLSNNGTLGTGSGTDTADPTWVAGYPFGSLGLQSVLVEPQSTNYSLRFYGHGVNDIDRVKIPIDPHVPADVGGSFTLEFWMKAASGNNSGSCNTGNDNWITGNTIFDRDVFNAGDHGDYGLSLHGGKIAFGVNNGSSGAGICSTVTVDDGQWHHIAVTRNGSTGELRIYADGTQRGQQESGPTGDLSYRDGRSTNDNEDDPFLVIGVEKHDAGSGYPSFKGWIDEVRISNNIRYSSNFTRPSQPFTTDGNTVALYHFDEGPAGDCPTNKVIVDSSGASGGPSDGFCRFGGSAPAGPVYTTDTPPFGTPDTTPPVITNISAGPLDTVAIISWTTDDPATSRVEYGVVGSLTESTETTELVTSHQVVLTGLSPQTTYDFRVRSRNEANLETIDPAGPGSHSFSTLAEGDIEKIYLPLITKEQ